LLKACSSTGAISRLISWPMPRQCSAFC